MSQTNYISLTNTEQGPSYEALLAENVQLKRALVEKDQEIEQVRATAQFSVDQANAARDDYMEQYLQAQNECKQKDRQVKEKETIIRGYTKELTWIRDFIYNPGYSPSQKIAGITARDHCRSGEPTRIYIVTKAKQVGVVPNTYSSALQGLADYGKIIREVKDPEHVGEKINKKGEKVPAYNIPELITFTKEFLEDPSIPVEKKPKKSGGNMKEKAAAKVCPKCNSIHIQDNKMYFCGTCNHQWEEGERKDTNKDAAITPDNPRPAPDHTEEPTEQVFLFPQDEPRTPKADQPKEYDGPEPPPRRRPICHPDATWVWDDLIELYTCSRCNHG